MTEELQKLEGVGEKVSSPHVPATVERAQVPGPVGVLASWKSLAMLFFAFNCPSYRWQAGREASRSRCVRMTVGDQSEGQQLPSDTPSCCVCKAPPDSSAQVSRRELTIALGCACWACSSSPADALAALVKPSSKLLEQYDVPRDKLKDAGFAMGMATGMADYEEAVAPKKDPLFARMLEALPRTREPVIVELGMGSFPNARYYKYRPRGLDIIGVDPNDSMEKYAMRNAVPLLNAGSSVRVTHGVGEVLPFKDRSVDAVVCTLTLCSIPDPALALAEVKRILRPGGKFLFCEHVLSETDPKLAAEQQARNAAQVKRADGCNLNRRTLETIKAAGFAELDAEYFELQDFFVLNPTVAGIAVA